jgi:hypothetical protein
MGQGGGDIEAAMKSRKAPVTLKAQRKKLKEQLQQSQDLQQNQPPAKAQPAQAATEKELVDSASSLPQAWVLELSSFQLDGVRTGPDGFEPTAATVLNTTPKQWNNGTQQQSLSSAVNFMCSPVRNPLLAIL